MSTIKGIKVGSTKITSTYIDNNTESDVKEINVTTVSLESVDAPSNTTYTGDEQCPTPSVRAIVDGVETILVKDTDYTLAYSNNTNAGIATVTATGINNFTGELSVNWTINKATIDVTSSDVESTYDGNYHGRNIIVSTVDGAKTTITYSIKSGNYDSSYSPSYELTEYPQIKNVIDSGYVYYKVTADNHEDATGYYKITITPKTASLVWGDNLWIYDGSEHSTTCVVNNLEAGDECKVTLTNNSITNIGTVVVTATGLSNTNYTLPDSGTTYAISVKAGMYVKQSNSWVTVKSIYKKVSGTWEEVNPNDWNTVFDKDKSYIHKEI